ncbi:MAG: DUF5698 domain-containing protein [Planctomycetota bacterium]
MPEFGGHSVWLIPLLVFIARIFDVSLGTLRMIMVISEHRFASATLWFLEVMIWVVAVGGVVKHPDNPAAIVAFAGGFATGTPVGITIENKLANGFRIVHRKQVGNLLERIRASMPDAILSVERAEKISGYAVDAGGPRARLLWIRFGGVRK